MSSLNKAQIIGRLGRDPEVRHLQNGDAVCTLSVATSEKWKDKQSGETKEATEWHRIVLYGKLAEIAGQYLKKGSLAYFEGKLKTRKWQDKDGKDNYTTEINATEMRMLSGSGDGGGEGRDSNNEGSRTQTQQRPAAAPAQQKAKAPADFDDDAPF